jgi:hypothetical protein
LGGHGQEPGGKIQVGNVPAAPYDGNVLIQTRSGRLILPVGFSAGPGHEGLLDHSGSFGTLLGQRVRIESYAHWPEPDNAFVFYRRGRLCSAISKDDG